MAKMPSLEYQQGWQQKRIAEALGVSKGAMIQWITRGRKLHILLRKITGKVLVIWDGSPIHRAKVIKEFLTAGAAKRLHLKRLPGYAPDLNSQEGV